jgi:hypothetical protein
MAKKRRRKYSRGSGEEVRREMHRYKRGRAKSGRGGKGGKVKSRKQAIAIAPRHARKGRKFLERSAEVFSPKLAKLSHWRSRQRLTFPDRLETDGPSLLRPRDWSAVINGAVPIMIAIPIMIANDAHDGQFQAAVYRF